jgi:hypothetical protein
MSKKKEELTDGDVFVPDAERENEVWTAKPLSLRNSVLLVRLLASVLAKAALQWEHLIDVKTGSITEEGVIELIALLDASLFRSVLSIITATDPETVEDTFNLDKAIQVIVEFWQQEDFSSILKKVRRLATNQEFQERNAG